MSRPLNYPALRLINYAIKMDNAFNVNLEGGNIISKLFSKRLLNISKTQPFEDAGSALETLIDETSDFQKELKQSQGN